MDLSSVLNPSGGMNSAESMPHMSSLGNLGLGAMPGMPGVGAFSDILNSELNLNQSIPADVDSILQRLEHGKPLHGETPQSAANKIFDALDSILMGVHQLFSGFGHAMAASSEQEMQDVDRLINGLKHHHKQFETADVAGKLGETWEVLRKKKSPLFHSVHAYFLQVSISFHGTQASSDGVNSASQQHQYSMMARVQLLSVVNKFETCKEKEEILTVLEPVEESLETDMSDVGIDESVVLDSSDSETSTETSLS